jgi:hypothetical protein
MGEPVTHEKQITPDWLTERLRRHGCLAAGGHVAAIAVCSFRTLYSHIFRLEVSYSIDAASAPTTLPSKLILKVPSSDNETALKMGREEVAAYKTFARMMDDPPIVRCFDAHTWPATNGSHLLIEDLSETHFQPEMPIPPSKRHGELCVEALAKFHAFWWEHPDLGTKVGEFFDEKAIREVVAKLREALPGLIAHLGDALSPARREALERSLWFVESLWRERLTSIKRNTLIHGDAHQWNILHPKETAQGRAFLIDLATSNRIRPATNDLAYMMALKWYPERRALMEEALLRHYHAALLSGGVKDYSWEDCRRDYLYSVITHLFTPVFQWADKTMPATVWWHNLERIAEAFKDLNCAELI